MDKLIHTYKKPRSRQRIEIHEDLSMDPDGWFLDFRYIENKTNKIAHSHCVIRKDLENWIQGIQSQGWILVNE